MKHILHLVLGLKLWIFIRNNFNRLAFLLIGFLLINYVEKELKLYFLHSENTQYIPILIICKNVLYLSLAIIFWAWQLINSFKEKNKRPERLIYQSEKDEFSFIRNRGLKTKEDILNNLIKNKNYLE